MKLKVDPDFRILKAKKYEPLGDPFNEKEDNYIEYVDITPDKKTLLNLGEAGYSISEALAELIDNSIDASIDEKVEVSIWLKPPTIEISDNGKGMPKSVASKVLKLGFSTKHKEDTLGKFGLGLKTACLSLGSCFKINTSPEYIDEEYSIEFNSKHWLNLGSWSKYPFSTKRLISSKSYTKLNITDLKIDINEKVLKKLIAELSERFGPFIQNKNLSLFINGKICNPKVPKLTEEGRKEFKIKLNSGEINGWYGFKLADSVKDYYGFHTYRNGRLITSYDKIGITKETKSKQLIGEIHMNHVPVSHNKRQWITESQKYKEVLNIISEELRTKDVRLKTLISGLPAQSGIVEGTAKVVHLHAHTPIEELEKIEEGDILVTGMTRPQFILQMQKAKAIVTDQGGMLCHAAILAREFGIPCIVGTQHGTQILKDGQKIILDGAKGVIYAAD